MVFRKFDPPRKVYDSVIHMLRLGRQWTEAEFNLTCDVRLAGGPPLNRTPVRSLELLSRSQVLAQLAPERQQQRVVNDDESDSWHIPSDESSGSD